MRCEHCNRVDTVFSKATEFTEVTDSNDENFGRFQIDYIKRCIFCGCGDAIPGGYTSEPWDDSFLNAIFQRKEEAYNDDLV